MRDVGILIWVALLVIGVIGSMRRQLKAAQRTSGGPATLRGPTAPAASPPASPGPVSVASADVAPWLQRIVSAMPQPPATVAPKPPPPRPPPPRPAPAPVQEHRQVGPSPRRRGLFARPGSVAQAVVTAEVLGKPRAFNDEYFRY
jgi:hypothetical protein